MKREEIIRAIMKFDFKSCPSNYLRFALKTKWDEKEMMKTPNLVLHDLWRDLRNNKNK